MRRVLKRNCIFQSGTLSFSALVIAGRLTCSFLYIPNLFPVELDVLVGAPSHAISLANCDIIKILPKHSTPMCNPRAVQSTSRAIPNPTVTVSRSTRAADLASRRSLTAATPNMLWANKPRLAADKQLRQHQ